MSYIGANAQGLIANVDGGTVENATITDSVIVPISQFSFRNKLINGNFDFWQRSTSQTATSGYGTADRWSPLYNGSARTASQQSFTNGQTDVPNNPRFYFRHAVTSSSGDANYVHTYQAIEDVRILAGKTVTLSFYAKADSNKNIATEFTQWFGTGGSPSSWNNGLSVTTHNLTTSWQKFTVTTVIPSISGKTIGSDANTSYTGIYFHFDAGANFNARTNSLGQQSGTFDIAQVQLEEGTVVTPFEHRLTSVELSLCQRYYQYYSYVPFFSMNPSASNTYWGTSLSFSTTMRANPTVIFTAPNSGTAARIERWGGTDLTVSSANAGKTNLSYAVLSSGNQSYDGAQANVTLTAEL